MIKQYINNIFISAVFVFVLFFSFSNSTAAIYAKMPSTDAVDSSPQDPAGLIMSSLYFFFRPETYFTLLFFIVLFIINFILLKKQQDETKLRSVMLVANIMAALLIFFLLGAFILTDSVNTPMMST